MSTILEVAGNSKAFGSLKVIDGFDFELAEGEEITDEEITDEDKKSDEKPKKDADQDESSEES